MISNIEKLQEFGNSSASGLAQTLGALLGREVSVSLSQVSETELSSLAPALDSPFLVSDLKGSGVVNGSAQILLHQKDSSIIADLLIGQDGTAAPEKMTELHLSAFGEVVHQLVDVFNGELKKIADSKSAWTLVDTAALEPSDLPGRLGKLGQNLLVFEFGLFIQDLISGVLLFCLPEGVATRISSGAEKPATSPVPGPIQTGAATVGTQTRTGGSSMQQLDNEFSGASRPAGGNIGLLLDVPLKLTVELGRTTKLVKEILALAPGSVVELDKLAGEAVDILVNEKLIAKGEVVVIDENFGVRITEIINPEERLTAVQA
jgi:flagellar motor switch protein FliN